MPRRMKECIQFRGRQIHNYIITCYQNLIKALLISLSTLNSSKRSVNLKFSTKLKVRHQYNKKLQQFYTCNYRKFKFQFICIKYIHNYNWLPLSKVTILPITYFKKKTYKISLITTRHFLFSVSDCYRGQFNFLTSFRWLKTMFTVRINGFLKLLQLILLSMIMESTFQYINVTEIVYKRMWSHNFYGVIFWKYVNEIIVICFY